MSAATDSNTESATHPAGRPLTRRGVLWLGLKCDVKCVFCYDKKLSASEKKWLPYEGPNGARTAVDRFRNVYHNSFVDFMGGETTLYPHIYDLVAHCARIGISPTLITHGLHLSDKTRVAKFKECGIGDFLISVQGIGELNDQILVYKARNGQSATEKQVQALENLVEAGIPFRFNVVLLDWNKHQLKEIVEMGVRYGVRVINFLTFNPYFEWNADTPVPFQGRHSEIAPYLKGAIDVCRDNGVEANVRYMPICLMQGYEEHVHTGYQLPYDSHEWDYNSWYDCGEPAPASAEWYYTASQRQQARHGYIYGEACGSCAVRNICDGFHGQYAARFGFDEARPYAGDPVTSPTHFGARQMKKIPARSAEEVPAATHYLPILKLSQTEADGRERAGLLRA